MKIVDHLSPEYEKPEDKRKLKRAIEKFLKYNKETEKLWPVHASTALNFYEKFMSNTYTKLIKANPEVNRAFIIRVSLLNDLIKLASKAKYVKITLVQIPENFKPINSNLEISNNSRNLYFLFTLADAHNKPHYCDYFDLNSFNDSTEPMPVHKDDVTLCLEEFHAIDKKGSLRKKMLESNPIKTNTEHIYVNLQQLQSRLLNQFEPKGMTNIALVFCEIDIEDRASAAQGHTKLIKKNPQHFGCLWLGIKRNYTLVQNAPIYDFNSLCPNMCPEE